MSHGFRFEMSGDYQLVQLSNGAKTLFSASYGEKMHPGLGPQAEAELLYVRQLNLCERLQKSTGEFVVWDVGLGGAANALTALRALREIPGELRLISFDNTAEPLEFAAANSGQLKYPAGYETQLAELLQTGRVAFLNGRLKVEWQFVLADFPGWLAAHVKSDTISENRLRLPAPDAIFYDAFSPAKNPAMWTLPVFRKLFAALEPAKPCALTTYSRSTLIRSTLLLAGFYVGAGHATGMKEETTIAANKSELIAEPLGMRWLERAMRSDSAEPLPEAACVRKPLSPDTARALENHRQFAGKPAI